VADWSGARLGAEDLEGEMLGVPVGRVSVTNRGNSDDKATTGTLQLHHVRPRRGRVMAHVDGVRVVMVVA